MSSGQYLLTTTIEEKSSRTMEVILSAVSPLELLTGKILGQMAVGLTLLITYSSMGILSLVSMAMLGFLDPTLLIYLFIFFLITYVIMGSHHGGDRIRGERIARSAVADDARHLVDDDSVAVLAIRLRATRIPSSRLRQFHPADERLRDAAAADLDSPPPMWQVWLSIVVGSRPPAARCGSRRASSRSAFSCTAVRRILRRW